MSRARAQLLLLLLSGATPAFAYKRSVNSGGVTIWWSIRGHPFQIDAMGTPDIPGMAAFTAIRTSFQTWAAVSCSDLVFQDQGLSLDPKDRVVGYFPGQSNRNLVLFRTRRCGNGNNGGVVPPGDPCLTQGGCGNAYDCWDDITHGAGVIATTTTTSNRFTGQINDSDIEINDSVGTDGTKFIFTAVDGVPCTDPNQTGCVRMDVQNTITHEAGHTLGLDHTTDPTATMYATAPQGETSKRVLGNDDIQAICTIYPRGKETVTGNLDPITLTPLGSSNGGCGCSQAQTGPGAALGALVLLLQIRRRSRRKPQLAISASRKIASPALRESGSVA
jgi:MYXO-CTERM domain-containing protein